MGRPNIEKRDRLRIEAFLDRQSLALTTEQVALLLDYADRLMHWNQSINLVSCKTTAELIDRHILDALTVLPHLKATIVADAGCGAGLPGIPLAIARPDIHFHLVDSNAKKTGFLYTAVTGLGLGNVMIHNCRLHALPASVQPDCLVSRAFGPLPELLQECESVLPGGANLLLMKGRKVTEELEAVKSPFEQIALHDLSTGSEAGQSMLLVLRKSTLD